MSDAAAVRDDQGQQHVVEEAADAPAEVSTGIAKSGATATAVAVAAAGGSGDAHAGLDQQQQEAAADYFELPPGYEDYSSSYYSAYAASSYPPGESLLLGPCKGGQGEGSQLPPTQTQRQPLA